MSEYPALRMALIQEILAKGLRPRDVAERLAADASENRGKRQVARVDEIDLLMRMGDTWNPKNAART